MVNFVSVFCLVALLGVFVAMFIGLYSLRKGDE